MGSPQGTVATYAERRIEHGHRATGPGFSSRKSARTRCGRCTNRLLTAARLIGNRVRSGEEGGRGHNRSSGLHGQESGRTSCGKGGQGPEGRVSVRAAGNSGTLSRGCSRNRQVPEPVPMVFVGAPFVIACINGSNSHLKVGLAYSTGTIGVGSGAKSRPLRTAMRFRLGTTSRVWCPAPEPQYASFGKQAQCPSLLLHQPLPTDSAQTSLPM